MAETPKKKRAALCLSGQLRSLEKTYKGWVEENIFNCNPDWDIDVFAHTWFAQEDVGVQYQLAGGRGPGCAEIPQDVVSKLYELYNPQKALVEQQVDFKERSKHPAGTHNPDWRLSKMYSIKQSCGLKCVYEKENDMKYDAVIFSRYDLDIRPVHLSSYDMNFYNTSRHAHTNLSVDVTHAICSSDIFNTFSLLYDQALHVALTTGQLPPDENIAKLLLEHHEIGIRAHSCLDGYAFVRS